MGGRIPATVNYLAKCLLGILNRSTWRSAWRLGTRRLDTRRLGAWSLSVCIVLVLCLFWVSPVWAIQPLHYTDLKFPPLPDIQLPDYTRYTLANGMVVYLVEDHELPLVDGVALVRAGERWEPDERVGLADVTGDLLRSGGTVQHPVEVLNRLLEERAASIESSIGTTVGRITFSSLSADLPVIFPLFAEVLQTPAFAPDPLELEKTKRRGAIARRNDNPKNIASREFYKLIYGSTSPYARTLEYADLARIQRNDVVQFHQQYFQPNRMLLGVVGDFDTVAMKALIEKVFGSWQPSGAVGQQMNQTLPPVQQATPSGIFVVEQPQLTQSYVLMGHLGGQLDSADYPALDVMNNVMNGFGGRLFNELRSRQALAYSVYAYWRAQFDYPGVYIAGGQTRGEATVPLIQGLKTEIERLQRNRITPQELEYAKDSTLNSFVFNFQSPYQTISRLMRYEYYGYPADFLSRYRRGVEATTIVDIERVARLYLRTDKLVTLVVGNIDKIQPPLDTLAAGESIPQLDITIPEP